MRKWATLLLLLGFAWPAMAAKTKSVEQMEQWLIKLHGKPDGKVAGELDDVQLTERVSLARLARWEAEFPGPRAHEQLMKLADLSAFLNPPAADVLRDPPPDMETQQRIAWMAEEYVKTTIMRLPDLLATRETTHFENTLSHRVGYSYPGSMAMDEHASLSGLPIQTPGMATTAEYRTLHSTGETSTTVTYRDGHEVHDADTGKGKKEEEPALGLTTSGEFGPILGAVIGDVIQSGVTWLRWEQGASEPVAVFHYAVAEGESHFRVGITSGGKVQALYPAYHGEIAIDPETGAILRLSEVADMTPPHAAMGAAIVVEYAPVTIGDRSYICPVRGVAFSEIPVPSAGTAEGSAGPMQTALNDVAFTHYHEFGSEARIVTNESGNGGTNAASGSGTPETEAIGSAAPASAPATTSATASEEALAAEAATPGASATPTTATSATPRTTEVATTPTAGAAPAEATGTPVAGSVPPEAATPAESATAPNAPATGTVIHAKSNLVLVDVVVTDHDKPVKGLDRSRFHVFEDGHEVPIASIEENEPPASVEIAKAPPLPPGTYSNVPVYPETSAVNVLLLDALNTPMSDQEQVRKQMIAYLSTIKPGTAMAVFTLSSRLRMVAGFTTDVAKLTQTLESRKANARSSADVGTGRNESLSSSLTQAASSVATSNDPGTYWLVGQIMQFAADTTTYETDQRVTMTLDALSELARYLTAIPGKKNLIWFSGSFPIGLSPDAMLTTPIKNVRDYSGEVQRTSALLSAARVSVDPVDARGLMTAPTADSSYTAPLATLQGAAVPVANDNRDFTMQTSQEQGTMSTIAAETGGRAYTNSNGLKEAVQKIVASGSSYYALSYVPPEETGGKQGADFRKVEVKVDGGKYQLSYRRGYYRDDGSKPASGSGGVPGAVTAAAVLSAPPSTQILFQARVLPEGDPQFNGVALDDKAAGEKSSSFPGGAHRYVVDLSVDLQDLTFAEGADGARRTQTRDCFGGL